MAFTNSYRLERVYFEKLKSSIDILKSFLDSETDEKARALLENGIDDNGAILLLYRNLGEAWAELSDLIKKTENKIDDVKDAADAYHDELNERIDEVNNYLMANIRELDQRVTSLETRVTSLETRMTAAETAITEIRGIITTIQAGLADHETRIAALEECCEDVQDAITDLETSVAGKQDTLTAGNNITIDSNNVISASGGGTIELFGLSNIVNTTVPITLSVSYLQIGETVTRLIIYGDTQTEVLNFTKTQLQAAKRLDIVINDQTIGNVDTNYKILDGNLMITISFIDDNDNVVSGFTETMPYGWYKDGSHTSSSFKNKKGQISIPIKYPANANKARFTFQLTGYFEVFEPYESFLQPDISVFNAASRNNVLIRLMG